MRFVLYNLSRYHEVRRGYGVWEEGVGGKKGGLGFVVKYRFVSTAIPGNGVDSTGFSI